MEQLRSRRMKQPELYIEAKGMDIDLQWNQEVDSSHLTGRILWCWNDFNLLQEDGGIYLR